MYDVAIIGAGPGGYSAACLLAKNGLKTVVIEKERAGGVCLNVGCIPTKALISKAEKIGLVREGAISGLKGLNYEAIDRAEVNGEVAKVADNMAKGIEFLFKKNNVDQLKGEARFLGPKKLAVKGADGEQELEAKQIIIAAGSRNKDFKELLSNRQAGSRVLDSTDALFLDEIPQSLTVIGGGAIGVELSYVYSKLGSQVTLLEYLPTLLPGMDEECGKTLERSFKRKKIKVECSAAVKDVTAASDGCRVVYEKKGKEVELESDYVLLATGRTPNSDLLNLEAAGVELNEQGYIIVDKESMKTNVEGIYAIGDIIAGSPLLAHVAYDEARIVAETILGKREGFTVDNMRVPFCIYSYPQAAGFGLDEQRAKEAGDSYEVLKVHFKASGKAAAIGKSDGFVKLIVNRESELLEGAYLVGPEATELIHELLIAVKAKVTLREIADTMHAHPTLSELIWEAAKGFYGLALH